jgi:gliding motility-associated-like protein
LKTTLLFTILSLFFLSITTVTAQGSRNALQFDGSDDYVFFDYNNRGITNEVTVEAWVKTKASKLQLITAKYDRDGERGYQLVMRDGKAAFSGRDGSGLYRISGYSPRIINDDKWHHLAGVFKNGTWSIYIDGILESESITGYTMANISSNAPFTVGNYYMVNNDFYQGQVDELRIWKRGLSVDEIREGMCQKADKTNTDLVVYLKFDEGNGSVLMDHSTYGINGTLRNMSPSTAWVTSGAPIGDKSVYKYGKSWLQNLGIVTNTASFFVRGAEAGTEAFHVYVVESTPYMTNGLSDPDRLKEYFGVFKVGNAELRYNLLHHHAYPTCDVTLYKRQDNAASPWVAIAVSTDILGLSYYGTDYTGEYAAIEQKSSPVEISGPRSICSGERATLSIKPPNGTVLWNTGAKTSSIEVTQGGTYTVVVTERGCQRSASITLETECLVIPNIITPNGDGKNDTFVLQGVNIDQVEIEIFDRWGNSVYKRSTYDNKWAGASGGMYYYHIKSHQTGKVYKGWVEVMR